MSLTERADEIARLFSEAARHAALGELTEAAEHGRQAADLCDDQTTALLHGES